jgi:hypothetical protein
MLQNKEGKQPNVQAESRLAREDLFEEGHKERRGKGTRKGAAKTRQRRCKRLSHTVSSKGMQGQLVCDLLRLWTSAGFCPAPEH